MTDFEYAHYHDCPILGPNTRLPRALMADSNGEYILYYHHKCPFCDATSDEKEFAPGVTDNGDGSCSVDIRIAEKLHGK